jgi:hypothetical protein
MNEVMPILKNLSKEKLPTSTEITKIISYGPGYLVVQASDGNKYKRSGGSLSWRNNNPGNLKFGEFAKKRGAVGPGYGQHAIFPDVATGLQAQKELLFSDERGYNTKSISEAIAIYAPAGDGNSPKEYAAYVAKKLGVPKTTKLSALSDKKKIKLVEVMTTYEGYKEGTVVKL